MLVSQEARQMYDGELTISEAIQSGNPYRSVPFSYNLTGASGVLLVSEKQSYANARVYILEETIGQINLENLKTGTTYYYKAIVDGQEYPGTFQTVPSTRFVSLPGVENTRDIGGYATLDGKIVRQGLLIRGVELDGLVNTAYFLPDDAVDDVQSTFGFVRELDLRSSDIYSGEYQSRLGADVEHSFHNAPQYGAIFNRDHHASLRAIFSELAEPANYPMYFHCTWGTDRTGTLIFLLQGILNMSEEDMIREYQMTGFTFDYIVASTSLDVIINGMQPYEGDTLQEKIVSFLTTDVGVTESEIQSIRNIFLAEKP